METHAKTAQPLQWAPYGFMCERFEDEANHAVAPRSWNGPPFLEWVEERTDELAAFAWPRWAAGRWHGDAANNAESLTRADLEIMSRCGARFEQPARLAGGARSNRWWFNWEDDLLNMAWRSRFDLAFPQCPVPPEDFARAFGELAIDRYYGSLVFLLKRHLQRPRAYQTSQILGVSPIRPQPSLSAWSPSAISGHAFQGLMGCLATYFAFPTLGPYRHALVMLAADIGDRRVLAGIHYPSDNAMSWWLAFQCIDHISQDPTQGDAMRAFVRDAVTGSFLWDEMRKKTAAAHAPIVKKLLRLVSGN
jgi:membrane-associated phospholipid phosphatase